MRTRKKDDIDLDKFIDRIEIPHDDRATLVIDEPRIVDHREFKIIDAESRIRTPVFFTGYLCADG